MLKTAIIYDEITGRMDGGYCVYDDEAVPDGSTLSERVPVILAKSPTRRLLLLDGKVTFDPATQRVIDGQIVTEPPTVTELATRSVDAQDRLIFEINFDQENRIRALESKPAITKAQYRTALIAKLVEIGALMAAKL